MIRRAIDVSSQQLLESEEEPMETMRKEVSELQAKVESIEKFLA